MAAPRPLFGLYHPGGQLLGIMLGQFPSSLIPGLQVGQLDPQDGGLYLIQAGIYSQKAVLILAARAMVAEEAQGLSELEVIGDHHPRLSIGSQVLGEIEAEAAQVPKAPRRPPLIPG